MSREQSLRRRVRAATWIMIIGLVVSGVTAIPLVQETDFLVRFVAPDGLFAEDSEIGSWLSQINRALRETDSTHPQLLYGTDWLAFGHIVIALAFVGALRDPVRNKWLFEFGLMACVLVIPWALVFGAVRGIPVWWRLIDCSFGVFGALPMWLCRKWTAQLERETIR